MRRFDQDLLPAAYGLLGVIVVLSVIGYAAGEVWPIYVAALVYAVTLLVYVLPASADLINRRHNIGGVVAALLLTMAVTPTALGVGSVFATAASALDAFDFGEEPEMDFGGFDDTEGEETSDYSSATTPEECEEIWLSDFSDSADADRDDCLERVGG